jgi:hypothetical protein
VINEEQTSYNIIYNLDPIIFFPLLPLLFTDLESACVSPRHYFCVGGGERCRYDAAMDVAASDYV